MDGALLRTPGNTQRPDMIGDPEILGEHRRRPDLVRHDRVRRSGAEHVRQPDPQTAPASTGRRYVNLDASLVKKLPFGSRYAEFRVDAFNVTNSLHANNPGTTFGSATFGQITGAFDPRLVRFGLRFVF